MSVFLRHIKIIMKTLGTKLGLFAMAVLILISTKVQSQGLNGPGIKLGVFGNLTEYDGDLVNKSNFYRFKHNKPGFGIYLSERLNPSFTLEQKFQMYTTSFKPEVLPEFKAEFINFNLGLRYNFANGYFINESAWVNPFLYVGAGGSNINSNANSGSVNALNIAMGAGFMFKLSDKIALETSSILNWPQNDSWDGATGIDELNDLSLVHSVGLVFNLGKAKDTDGDGVSDGKDVEPNTPAGVVVDKNGKSLDMDADNVPDYLDKCKDLAGIASMNGCPDKDGDGIADDVDKCPAAPGLARFGGCPDTDADGIEDSKDKCPNLKGLDIFMGCPDTDGDGIEDSKDKCLDTEKGIKVDNVGCPSDIDADGVIDSKDKCPTIKGDVNNFGCPVIKEEVKKRLQFAARSILFESSKASIKTSSYPMLVEIATIMQEYKDYSLRITGHTDNSGKQESNLILSQARVDAVKSYLIIKGVSPDKIEAIGFGSQRPIADNKTVTGRAENRRVEMELFLK